MLKAFGMARKQQTVRGKQRYKFLQNCNYSHPPIARSASTI